MKDVIRDRGDVALIALVFRKQIKHGDDVRLILRGVHSGTVSGRRGDVRRKIHHLTAVFHESGRLKVLSDLVQGIRDQLVKRKRVACLLFQFLQAFGIHLHGVHDVQRIVRVLYGSEDAFGNQYVQYRLYLVERRRPGETGRDVLQCGTEQRRGACASSAAVLFVQGVEQKRNFQHAFLPFVFAERLKVIVVADRVHERVFQIDVFRVKEVVPQEIGGLEIPLPVLKADIIQKPTEITPFRVALRVIAAEELKHRALIRANVLRDIFQQIRCVGLHGKELYKVLFAYGRVTLYNSLYGIALDIAEQISADKFPFLR